MADRQHALIVGGSVGGLMVAGLLRAVGWDVTVFERTVGDLAGRGAGLGISAELLDVMRRIGAPFEASSGVAHSAYVWMDARGDIVFEHIRPTVGSTWPRVYQPLRDILPNSSYRQGMTLERVEQGPGVVCAIFSDGKRAEGDLLVAADGVFSTVRNQFISGVAPRYAGYVAWRGIVEERDVPDATRAVIADHLVFCFPEREMLLAMAVPGPGEDMRLGHRRIYFIWYRPADEEVLADLFTDRTGRNHGRSIPPPLIRESFVQALKTHGGEVLAPPIAAIVDQVEQPLLQAITDMESHRLVFGRVAIMGDAAFVARPHTAGGVSKAALDAQCLAECLAAADGKVGAGLARYEALQLDFGRRLVAHSRYLGASLDARNSVTERVRDERRIIREYGAPGLLHDVDVVGFRPMSGSESHDLTQRRGL